jgi:hypothetical protein
MKTRAHPADSGQVHGGWKEGISGADARLPRGIWLGPSDGAFARSSWDSREDAVHAGSHGCPGQDGSEMPVPRGAVTPATRPLHGMGGIEDRGESLFSPDPVQGAHVGHQVVVSEGGAALRESKRFPQPEAFSLPAAMGAEVPRGPKTAPS